MIVTYQGKEPWGIPRHSQIRIDALPELHLTFTAEDVSGAVSVELDPGKYAIKVCNHDKTGINACSYRDEFYVGIDAKSFGRLRFMKPRFSKARMTTEGSRWYCTFPGCDEVSKSQIQQVLHEFDHFGVDLVAKLNAGEEQTIRATASKQAVIQEKTRAAEAFKKTGETGAAVVQTADDLDRLKAPKPRPVRKPAKPHPKTNPRGE